MPIIQLPTGKAIHISTYEWLFKLEEEDVDNFYQSCIADDIGSFINNPFTDRNVNARLEIDELILPEDLEQDIQD